MLRTYDVISDVIMPGLTICVEDRGALHRIIQFPQELSKKEHSDDIITMMSSVSDQSTWACRIPVRNNPLSPIVFEILSLKCYDSWRHYCHQNVPCSSGIGTIYTVSQNKKLSYRRETAHQLPTLRGARRFSPLTLPLNWPWPLPIGSP